MVNQTVSPRSFAKLKAVPPFAGIKELAVDHPFDRMKEKPATSEVDVIEIGTVVAKAFTELDSRDQNMTDPMKLAWAAREGAKMAIELQSEIGEA